MTMTTLFTCGCNMPGYLPESDVWTTASADAAKRFMIGELDRSGDIAVDAEEHDLTDDLSAEMEDLNLTDVSQGWDAFIGHMHYWIQAETMDAADANAILREQEEEWA